MAVIGGTQRISASATLSTLTDLPFVFLFIAMTFITAGPLGWGATVHYEAGYASRALPTTSFNPSSGTANDPSTRVDQAAQCTLDVYALWALAPQRRLRGLRQVRGGLVQDVARHAVGGGQLVDLRRERRDPCHAAPGAVPDLGCRQPRPAVRGSARRSRAL